MSYKTAIELELIIVIPQTNASVNTTTEPSVISSTHLCYEYTDLFYGISIPGKMKDFQFVLSFNTPPCDATSWTTFVPSSQKARYRTWKRQGIIEQFDSPDPWVSPLAVT